MAAIDEARSLFVEESLNRYVVALLRHTRSSSRLALGASPRSGIALLRVAKARALAEGRDYVLPDDVKAVAAPVLAHRLILAPEARSAGPDRRGDRRRGRRADPRPGLGDDPARAGSTLLLGVATYVVAWLFGAKALYPVATGLVLAPRSAPARGCGCRRAPIRLRRRAGKGACSRARTSGSRSRRGRRRASRCRRWRSPSGSPGSASGDDARCARGRGYRGTYVLERVPRGRYVVEEARATIDDPFGLARRRSSSDAGGSLLVYPRLVAARPALLRERAHAQDGRRLLLRRPAGFDLHSVREYEQGESLRKVHWRRPRGAAS